MIGVIADDTTGANDIGIMFAKNNYTAKVVVYRDHMNIVPDTDVIIIDIDSRLDRPEKSYAKAYAAARVLKQLGCTMIHKKTCSVFRGNVGREFDAMLDAVGAEFAVISLAFPKNGRTTLHGIHRVHGTLLEESEFRTDPVHPMTQSNLVAILQAQTQRRVGLIAIDTVRQGAAVLKQHIRQMEKAVQYVIVDSVTQDDLHTVAEVVRDEYLLGGSSALAEELPTFWAAKEQPHLLEAVDMRDTHGVLVVSGSLMPQTRAQTAALAAVGVPAIVMDSRLIFDLSQRAFQIEQAVEQACDLLRQGCDVLLMMNNDPGVVTETKASGKRQYGDPLATSKLVSAVLAEATARIVGATGLKRLVVAGGDTSGTVCRALNIEGNYVLREIESGLPSGLAIGRPMLIVLKSGSFGKEDFLLRAVEHLKQLTGKTIW